MRPINILNKEVSSFRQLARKRLSSNDYAQLSKHLRNVREDTDIWKIRSLSKIGHLCKKAIDAQAEALHIELGALQKLQLILEMRVQLTSRTFLYNKEEDQRYRSPSGQFINFMLDLSKAYNPKTILDFDAGECLIARFFASEHPASTINFLSPPDDLEKTTFIENFENFRNNPLIDLSTDITFPSNIHGIYADKEEIVDVLVDNTNYFDVTGIRSELFSDYFSELEFEEEENTTFSTDCCGISKKFFHEKFDLIMSCPNHPRRTDGDALFQKKLWSSLSSEWLNEDGHAIIVIDLKSARSQQTYALDKIQALIELPPNTIENSRKIYHLAIIGTNPSDELFVALYSPNKLHQANLIDNFLQHKVGNSVELGFLTSIEEFHSIDSIINLQKAEEMGAQRGLEKHKIKDLLRSEIITCRYSNDRTLEEAARHESPDTVFLPRTSSVEAVTDLSAYDRKGVERVSCFKLKTNEDVDATYLAGFFNTDLGRLIKKGLAGDDHWIAKDDLLNGFVFLPTFEMQIKIVENILEYQNIQSNISQIELDLWQSPTEETIALANENLSAFVTNPNDTTWIERLPYPLAAGYWRYHSEADSNVHRRVTLLLEFFEAMQIFYCIVHISALRKDEYHWLKIRDKIAKALGNAPQLDFENATMGVWHSILGTLAKYVRTYSDENKVETSDELLDIEQLYFVDSTTVVKQWSDKVLLRSIGKAIQIRNLVAHDGATGERQAQSHLSELNQALLDLKPLLQRGWKNTQLIAPRTLANDNNGNIQAECYILEGHNRTFLNRTISSIEYLDTTKLYIKSKSQKNALELNDLIRFLPSQLEGDNRDTIFFYSKFLYSQQQIKFITYDADTQMHLPIESGDCEELSEEFDPGRLF
jgi:hypothetical protein